MDELLWPLLHQVTEMYDIMYTTGQDVPSRTEIISHNRWKVFRRTTTIYVHNFSHFPLNWQINWTTNNEVPVWTLLLMISMISMVLNKNKLLIEPIFKYPCIKSVERGNKKMYLCKYIGLLCNFDFINDFNLSLTFWFGIFPTSIHRGVILIWANNLF